ncbi:MFS transporter [Adlercreutzia faecimuris]|uniref:MFS transporter n=1 Tax=Adlercreutzia faecimuris TaxID=2897341 RepID=A0ABS9WFP3_9ACTN|nr:MFS transporter [Adlercreutzia sp. JBNU-10]
MGEETERLWSRPYVVLLLAIFGVSLVTSMFNLGMTYYADLINGGIALAGVSAGVFSLASMASKPLAAAVSNRFDDGRVMVVCALLIAAAASLHHLAETIPALAVARAVHGVLFGVFSTAAGAGINQVLPRSRLAEGLGFFAVVSMLVPAVGPTLFLLIVTEGDLASFNGLFVLAAALCAGAAAVTFLGVPCFGPRNVLARHGRGGRAGEGAAGPDGAEAPAAAGAPGGEARALPRTFLGLEPRTLLPAGLLCLFCVAFSSVNFYLPLLAFERDLGDVGPVYAVFAAMTLGCRFLVGRRADEHGPDRYLTAGMACLALSYAAIPLCPTAAALYVVAVPLGLGMGTVAPFLNAYIVRRCSPERPGSASAAYYLAYDVGYSTGSFACGAIIAAAGWDVLFAGCAALCLVGLVLFRLTLARPGRG